MTSRVIAAAFAVQACASFERGDSATPASDVAPVETGGAADTDVAAAPLSFAQDVHPLLMNRCAICHKSDGIAAATALVLGGQADADLPGVLALVVAADPPSSPLLQKASGDTLHSGGTLFAKDSGDYSLISTWIAQGVKP